MNQPQAAEMLFHLLPLLDKNFVRPVDLQFRNVLSSLQVHVLVALLDKNATMTELANEILMSKQQMTPIVDKLVSEGLVQREHGSTDRRSITISITPAGLALLEHVKEETMKILEAKIARLTEADLSCLTNALRDLFKVLHKITVS